MIYRTNDDEEMCPNLYTSYFERRVVTRIRMWASISSLEDHVPRVLHALGVVADG